MADTQLTYVDSGVGETTRTTSIRIHADKVRMGEVNSPVYTLYDHAGQALYTINTQTHEFIDSSLEQVRARTERAMQMQNAMKAQMLAQLPQLPEEQRRMLEARIQQTEAMLKAPGPEIAYQETGETGQIQGIACKIRHITYNGQPGRSVCNAAADAIDSDDYQMLLNLFEYMDSIALATAQLQGFVAKPESSAATHRPGLALQVQALPQGPRSELSSLSNEAQDPALFQLPADYRPLEPMDAANPPPGQTR
ncbi:MAG: hypothetical protein R3E89_00185 [Thiolinea sp.]